MVLLATLMLPWVLPSASAATTTGTTAGLVNPEQPIREASSAVPVVGFSMTADTTEALDFITVSFSGGGFSANNDRDLRALDTDSSTSGVGLYRDDGSVDDKLDASDSPVTLDDVAWNGNRVEMDLTGHSEHLPSATVGTYSWFIVLRTSDVSGNLFDGDRIVVRMAANSIRATDGLLSATQPTTDVTANTLIARLTRTYDMTFGNGWVGPASVSVNKLAVLGLRIVDGGVTSNAGIADTLESLQLTLTETAGVVTSSDLQLISTDGATSGLALYWDDGTTDDAWDAGDTPVTLGSITPTTFSRGGVVFGMSFNPPLAVPDSSTGNFDLFFAIRTNDIVTGDRFNLRIESDTITVDGTLASDQNMPALFPYGSTEVPSLDVMGDNTPPQMRNERWSEGSLDLGAVGLDLYFNHLMMSTQFATARGDARDDHSGLSRANFSQQLGLVSSPANVSLFGSNVWRTYAGDYGIDNTSTDSASPVIVTIFDAVGNSFSSDNTGRVYNYTYRTEPILIKGNPGWNTLGSPSMWVDPAGVLWFGDSIVGSANAWLTVDVYSLYGGGVRMLTASTEPTLGGPTPANATYAPGANSVTWSTAYQFMANSTAGRGAVTISATDHSGASLSADFFYEEDTGAPAVSILSPTSLSTISGNFVVRATASDALTAINTVQVEIDEGTGFQNMFYDGAEYFLPYTSTLFTEGQHRIIVRATDKVGNAAAASVDVVFRNSVVDTVEPSVYIEQPWAGQIVSGTVTVLINASDNQGVGSVWLQVAGTPPRAASLNAASGLWEFAWDTASLTDGTVRLQATARDAQGNSATSASVDVWVDNHSPAGQIAGPVAGQKLAGIFVIRVFASDLVGVDTVTLNVFNENISMAYNPSTGYYEYEIDTRAHADGTYAARATVTDESGKVVQTSQTAFEIRNTDTWAGVRAATNFLFLLFVFFAFLALVMWARNGTLRRWLTSEGGSAMAAAKRTEEKDEEKK